MNEQTERVFFQTKRVERISKKIRSSVEKLSRTDFKIVDPSGNEFCWREIEDEQFKYELMQDYIYCVRLVGDKDFKSEFYSVEATRIIIKKGYRWDGASGPTLDTRNVIRASCVHDVYYQMIRRQQLPLIEKDFADLQLKKIMLEDWKPFTKLGRFFNAFRAGYYYYSVKYFGKSSCVPGSE